MKYSSQQYALALFEALRGKSVKERSQILGRFLLILMRKGDRSGLDAILRSVEGLYLKKEGSKKIELQMSSQSSPSLRREIKETLGKKLIVIEKVLPELLAGVRILINNNTLIDASAKHRLEHVFPRKNSWQI